MQDTPSRKLCSVAPGLGLVTIVHPGAAAPAVVAEHDDREHARSATPTCLAPHRLVDTTPPPPALSAPPNGTAGHVATP